jgi:hypothetical protein
MKWNLSLLKKHPLGTAAVIIIGGLLLYFLFLRGGSSSTVAAATNADVPPNEASLQMASIQSQTQLGLAGISANASITNTAAQYSYQSHVSDEQYQLGLANLSTQLQGLQVQANTTDISNQLASQTQLGLAQISGQTQTNLAAISSQTQIALGSQQLQGFQTMSNNTVALAKVYAGAAENGQDDSMWGSIAGAALTAAMFI